MNWYIGIGCLVTLLWLTLLDCSPSQGELPQKKGGSNDSEKDSLCVTIWPKMTRIQIGERVQVKVRVVNATEMSQTLQIRSNYDMQWETDNTHLLLGGPGTGISNRLTRIELEPGEAYEQTVELALVGDPPMKLISFRMAFTVDRGLEWSHFCALAWGQIELPADPDLQPPL